MASGVESDFAEAVWMTEARDADLEELLIPIVLQLAVMKNRDFREVGGPHWVRQAWRLLICFIIITVQETWTGEERKSKKARAQKRQKEQGKEGRRAKKTGKVAERAIGEHTKKD